ncbi:unnamed protein product [Protopolystoma xenopodis]|uniref:Uncharacterized protein n=1 Tax=Protopolystoma xenopodis TaxID=117903 RepID=A0A448WMT7_9PLAT|nr:unnamed protein product [Protopolystoma xenopodis]
MKACNYSLKTVVEFEHTMGHRLCLIFSCLSLYVWSESPCLLRLGNTHKSVSRSTSHRAQIPILQYCDRCERRLALVGVPKALEVTG